MVVLAALGGLAAWVGKDSKSFEGFIRETAGTDALEVQIEDRFSSIETKLDERFSALEAQIGGQITVIGEATASLTESLNSTTAMLNSTAATVRAVVSQQAQTSRTTAGPSAAWCGCRTGTCSGRHGRRHDPGRHGAEERAGLRVRRRWVWFRDSADVYHACLNISTKDAKGRGYAIQPDPYVVSHGIFTCRIPDDQGVTLGTAYLTVLPHYLSAPNAKNDPRPRCLSRSSRPSRKRGALNMETITTAYTGAGWNEVYEGDDLEVQLDADTEVRYAYGASEPDETVKGTLLLVDMTLRETVPSGTSVFMKLPTAPTTRNSRSTSSSSRRPDDHGHHQLHRLGLAPGGRGV